MDATEPPFAPGEAGARRAVARESLPPGTRLGDFEIVRTLGTGGFGAVYLARDRLLQRDVAIKEYLPAQIAFRAEGLRVEARNATVAAAYAAGLGAFVNEARILARFDHPAVVRVHRFWEANGTAYMVMPWVQGPTLREVRRALKCPPTEGWLRGMLDPLLDALALLHAQGIYHRDIAPDNILLPAPNEPVLLDFGAARRVAGDSTQTVTAVLKPSFAPIEQYAEAGPLRQGPWTDLYALGAVMVYMMTAVPPPPSTVRAVQDDLDRAMAVPPPGVSASFLAAVRWALAVRPQDRPQCVQELRNALDGRIAPPALAGHAPATRTAVPSLEPAAPGAPTGAGEATAARPGSPWMEGGRAAAHEVRTGVAPAVARETVAADRPETPALQAWAATVRLAELPSLQPLPLPLIQPPRRPPRALLVAGACAAVLVAGAALLLLQRGPVEPAAATWQALGRHAAQWSAPGAAAVPVEAMVAAAPVADVPVPPPEVEAEEPSASAATPQVVAGERADEAAAAEPAVPRLSHSGTAAARSWVKTSAPRVASPEGRKTEARRTRTAAQTRRVAASPREACGERSLIGMAICINRQCQSGPFRSHATCVELRRHWEERRTRTDQHP